MDLGLLYEEHHRKSRERAEHLGQAVKLFLETDEVKTRVIDAADRDCRGISVDFVDYANGSSGSTVEVHVDDKIKRELIESAYRACAFDETGRFLFRDSNHPTMIENTLHGIAREFGLEYVELHVNYSDREDFTQCEERFCHTLELGFKEPCFK